MMMGERAFLLPSADLPLEAGAVSSVVARPKVGEGDAMASRSAERIAENQAMFRMVNEEVSGWPERQAAPATETLMFYCECGDPKCFGRVHLTVQEYEAIRAHSCRFAVVPGHVFPEAERIVAQPDGYQVVEKYDELRGILESRDPRKGAYS